MVALACAPATAAAQAPFDAHGSVEQVYVTGLAKRAQVSLLDRSGDEVARKRADKQGGLLFRRVKPGGGYRVQLTKGGEKSEPLTVLTTRSAPAE